MNDKFETWAIVELFGHTKIAGVELFGHTKIAGKVAEQQIAGGTFLRVDVPDLGSQPGFTRFYGASAVYSITPTTEEIAQRAAEAMRVKPITVYGVVLPDPTSGGAERQLSATPADDWLALQDRQDRALNAYLDSDEEKPHQEYSSCGGLRDGEYATDRYCEVEEVSF